MSTFIISKEFVNKSKYAVENKAFYDSETFVEENKKYNQSCIDSLDYIEFADDFTQEMIVERKANYRKTKLQGVRLKYRDFFTESGEIIDIVITKKTKKTNLPINR